MNKKEFIDAIAKKLKVTQAAASDAVDAYNSTVMETLAEGEKVLLVGFGTYYTTIRAASKGRNPQTGKEMDIPEKTQARFTAGKGLKEGINAKRTGTKAAPKAVAPKKK